jgi:hypothetical protein
MVHPNYRGKGLFRKMREFSINERIKSERYFNYEFPGEVLSKQKDSHNRRYTNKTIKLIKIRTRGITTKKNTNISYSKKTRNTEKLRVKE